jgi:branched-chain amino acid transport system substrate-binding protein
MTLNRAALSCLVLAFGGCSLINGGFEECSTDSQCGASRVCLEKYCLPLPPQCRREVGGFDRPDSIRIAALLPLSEGLDGGAIDASEVAGLNAIDLAIEDVNGSSGVGNRLFSLYVCNTGRLSSVIREQTSWMVQQLGVPAIITSGSGQTAAATEVPARTDAGTLIISATATSPELIGLFQRNGTPWRVAPPDSLQVPVMARLLTQQPDYAGSHGYAVLYENSPYGRGIASGLRERLQALGRRSEISEYSSPIDVARFSNELQSFHAADAGATRTTIFVGFPVDLVPFVSAARTNPLLSLSSGHRWFFSDSAKDSTIINPQTFSQLVGALGTTPAQGAGTAYQDFRSRYRTRYQLDPNDYSFTGHSYDAAMLVMLSAAWAARDNGAITGVRMSEALLRVSAPAGTTYRLGPTTWRDASAALGQARSINLEGASGTLDFSADAGAPSAPYEIWQISDGGTFTTLRTENP